MPAFKDKLNADQIRALVAYVRAFSTKDATAK
jgi:mono/diheme cytochrome c family protein